jgi:hypothetical protein
MSPSLTPAPPPPSLSLYLSLSPSLPPSPSLYLFLSLSLCNQYGLQVKSLLIGSPAAKTGRIQVRCSTITNNNIPSLYYHTSPWETLVAVKP